MCSDRPSNAVGVNLDGILARVPTAVPHLSNDSIDAVLVRPPQPQSYRAQTDVVGHPGEPSILLASNDDRLAQPPVPPTLPERRIGKDWWVWHTRRHAAREGGRDWLL